MATITLNELENRYGRIAVRATDLRPVLTLGSQMYLSEVKDRFARGVGPDGTPWVPLKHRRPQGGNRPLLNTGLLRASYTAFATPWSFGVSTNAVQASLQHYGGTVKPVKGRYLTIPLTKEAVYAGRAPNMPDLFVSHNSRSLTLARREGKSNRLRHHWLLVTSVTIPARPQVGISQQLLDRFLPVLVNYLRTGSLV